MTMNRPKKQRKMVPIYAPDDILAGKKNPRKIGMMSDPDEPGPLILDRKTFESLTGFKIPGAEAEDETFDGA